MFMCPKYHKQRQNMNKNVKRMYMVHNIINKESLNDNMNKPSRKYQPFKNDVHNPIYMKQVLFPSFNIKMETRIEIIREVIKYVILSNRFNDTMNNIQLPSHMMLNDHINIT